MPPVTAGSRGVSLAPADSALQLPHARPAVPAAYELAVLCNRAMSRARLGDFRGAAAHAHVERDCK